MENKYYTPEISELFIGYKYEKLHKSCFTTDLHKGSLLPFVCEERWSPERIYSITEYGYGQFDFDKIRTKYLDMQDIIDSEWVEDQFCKNRAIVLNFKKKDWYLNYYYGEIPYIEIGKDNYDTGYNGECKSINELKKIEKWLKV